MIILARHVSLSWHIQTSAVLDVLVINSPTQLVAYYNCIQRDADAQSRVDTAVVSLLTKSSRLYLFKSRELLSFVPRLSSLQLDVRNISERETRMLLRNILFPFLSLFSTSMLSHRGLSAFLAKHADSLDSVYLGKCLCGPICPFRKRSTGGRWRLKEVRGPLSCVIHLLSAHTTQLTINSDSTSDRAIYRTFLRRLTAISLNILLLSTGFHPLETNVLETIRAAFPILSTLRLIESGHEDAQVSHLPTIFHPLSSLTHE